MSGEPRSRTLRSLRGRLVYLPRIDGAAVVELVYTQVSKTCGRKPLTVRLRPAAPLVRKRRESRPAAAGWTQVLEGSTPSSPTNIKLSDFCPPERSVWRAKRAISSAQKMFEQSCIIPPPNKQVPKYQQGRGCIFLAPALHHMVLFCY